ncbi:MAG TPA: prepilin-type N-terminal cleavage/methylation domain-containing protein [Gemmatimonadaceae bacterium]|nr:prepilin-type N-terminal cleavage/methylation domain-containing protein [Gemmatimonadaceae bacterium]
MNRMSQRIPVQSLTRSKKRSGFSMLEMLIVLIIMGILVKISMQKLATIMRHERVNRAAQVVVADLQNGFAMAGRQRAPVRLTFTPTTKTYVFSDRLTGTVYQTRVMNKVSEYALTTLTADPTQVDILPNGIGTAPITVTIAQGDYTRTVTASSAGFVRLVQ